MYNYKTPLREIHFSALEVFDYLPHYQQLTGCEDINEELFKTILDQGAKFSNETLVPINAGGDEQGCQWSQTGVTTPAGFKEAFKQYADMGWQGLASDSAYGGQGLPKSLGIIDGESRVGGCLAWSLCSALCLGAANTLLAFGSEAQKQLYLSRIIAGQWTATMCLTEAHCGTDLGLLRSKAEPQDDGSYAISGSKIFITYGEHDFTDNIIHIVLARLPGAPKGSKGISLFIVPKINTTSSGELLQGNGVSCGSIESKMGIHGSPTCVMNFDKARGYLLGEANKGLNCMFTFMNTMRLGTANQGVGHAELALQKSQHYARERLQMRSISGVKNPTAEADPIMVHPDVRRMLLTQKAIAEGGRMMVHYMAQTLDISERGSDQAQRQNAETKLSFTTPIGKAFLTELGLEAASLGIQCYGGHGYIRESGVEQNYRDARIATLYEGTTGIQALDLLGRKVLGSGGQSLKLITDDIQAFCQSDFNEPLSNMAEQLDQLCRQWLELTGNIGAKAMVDADEVGAASVDYLMYSGYIMLAYFWLKAARVAEAKLDQDSDGFYRAKLETAKFYYQRILPRTLSHREAALAGAESLMGIDEAGFCFL